MTSRPDKAANDAPEDIRDYAREELLGARQWRESKVGYLTGFSTLRESAATIGRQGGESVGRIRSMFGMAFRAEKAGRAVDPGIADSRERFVEAMAINGRTLGDVDRSVNNTYRQFWLYATLAVADIVLAIASLMIWGAVPSPYLIINAVLIMARFSPLLVLLPLLLRSGWTNWSFRRRRAEGIDSYLRSGALLPKKAPAQRRASPPVRSSTIASLALFGLGIAAVAAITMLGMGPALAQTANATDTAKNIFVDPSQQDLFIRLLAYVIPDTGPIPKPVEGVQTMHTAVKAGFLAFSGTLLFIGMTMSGWQILSGLVAAAKEGSALGRNYHEVWAPARVVIGFGMLTPIAGGICGAQLLVLYLIAWGGNLANVVYTPYMEKMTLSSIDTGGSTARDTANIANMDIATNVVKSIMAKELCNTALDQYVRTVVGQTATDPAIIKDPKWKTVTVQDYDTGQVVNPDMPSLNLIDKTVTRTIDYGPACGRIEVLQKYVNPQTTEELAATAIGSVRTAQVEAIQANLHTLAANLSQTYFNYGTGSTTRAFADAGNAQNAVDILKQARQGYMTAIAAAATQNYKNANTSNGWGGSDLEKVRNEAVSNGWAAAGTFYLTAARLQNAVYSAVSEGMKVTSADGTGIPNRSKAQEDILVGGGGKEGVLPGFNGWWQRNLNVLVPDISEQATRAQDDTTDLGKVLTKVFGGGVKLWQITGSSALALNPMQSMIDYGNRLMVAGGTFYTASAIIAASGENGFLKDLGDKATVVSFGLLSFGSGMLKAMAGLGGFAMFLSLAVIAAGALHAYIIPLVPYIMTVFFVASMLVLTVEALVAAPLWAFFHIRMDGQEFIDQVQRPGYMIAFNLILRPSLMIFGLIMSHLVFGAMCWFVAKTFTPAVMSLAGSTGIGLIGMPVMVVMLSYIDYHLATRSFQLITQVPDRVTRWFGQGGENLGEDHDSKQVAGFIGNQTVNRIESVTRGAQMAQRKRPGLSTSGETADTGDKGGGDKGGDKPSQGREQSRLPGGGVTGGAESAADPGGRV